MAKWGLLLMLLTILGTPLALAQYWLVFGIWPVSWWWFVVFTLVNVIQQKLAQVWAGKLLGEEEGV